MDWASHEPMKMMPMTIASDLEYTDSRHPRAFAQAGESAFACSARPGGAAPRGGLATATTAPAPVPAVRAAAWAAGDMVSAAPVRIVGSFAVSRPVRGPEPR